MSFKDKTWCASPNCNGKCGRKLSEHDMKLAIALGQDKYISYGYFCDYPTNFNLLDKTICKFGKMFSKR